MLADMGCRNTVFSAQAQSGDETVEGQSRVEQSSVDITVPFVGLIDYLIC